MGDLKLRMLEDVRIRWLSFVLRCLRTKLILFLCFQNLFLVGADGSENAYW